MLISTLVTAKYTYRKNKHEQPTPIKRELPTACSPCDECLAVFECKEQEQKLSQIK